MEASESNAPETPRKCNIEIRIPLLKHRAQWYERYKAYVDNEADTDTTGMCEIISSFRDLNVFNRARFRSRTTCNHDYTPEDSATKEEGSFQ